ncbi:hypothetical protein ACIGW4_22970 [Streptomyces sp. NPDC053513]|uniref:hypothetical protein n=1 Tax=unclassified Streptomyces TaxID=2593676 RepID=UPI0037D46970
MNRRTGFPSDLTGLLTAIVEALDVPMPSVDEADEREHYWLLERRASDVRIGLSVLLEYLDVDVLEDTVREIRHRTASNPITYTPFTSGKTDGEA